MLTTLRKHSNGIIAKALMAILVIAFGVWGIESVIPSLGARDVASVGGSPISIDTFQRYYNAFMRSVTQTQGRQLSAEEARLAGIPTLVINSLVANESYRLEANRMGLGISRGELTEQIFSDSRFKGPGGIFDRSLLAAFLRDLDLSEPAFIDDKRKQALRDQLDEGLIAGMSTPEVYARALHEYRTEKRSVEYLAIPLGLAGDAPAATDEDLRAHFAANRGRWRIPEYRGATILRLEPADLADPSKVADADARAVYAGQAAKFTTPEKRQVRQMTFDDRAAADAAAASLQSGKTFDDLIAERKLRPEDVDLGTIAKAAMVNKKAAEAAFNLAANSTSGVVDGDFGPVILAVGAVTPTTTQSFEEAQEAIKRDLAVQRAQRSLLDLHDKIIDAQSGGESLAEVGKRLELATTPVAAIDRSGRTPDGIALPLPQSAALMRAIFESDVGITNEPLQSQGRGFIWYDVTAVNAARDPNFEEVKDKVTASWTKEKLNAKSLAFAQGIADRLKGGEGFDKIGDELKLTVQTADAVTRETAAGNDLTGEVVAAAFGGKEGLVAVAAGATEGSHVVLRVNKVERPAFTPGDPADASILGELSNALSEDIVTQFAAGLRDGYGVSIDQRALQQAIGATGTGG